MLAPDINSIVHHPALVKDMSERGVCFSVGEVVALRYEHPQKGEHLSEKALDIERLFVV